MKLQACTTEKVLNRGCAPLAFLQELVAWAKTADGAIFDKNPNNDIYVKVINELGPWESLLHRRAVMLEVLRVLAGFESSWDWKEGVDTSRLGPTTPENAEAGAWQVSWDSRNLFKLESSKLISRYRILGGIDFQQTTKSNHQFALEWIARLLRHNTKHNGPLYKGSERAAIRSSLRSPDHSIYPWLSRVCVKEFMEELKKK